MRWDRLFADLEAQLEAAVTDRLDADVADRTRRELAATSFEGRLRGAVGRAVDLSVAGVGAMTGQLRRVGPGWLMVEIAGGPPAVVAARFVIGARDLPVATREADDAVTAGAATGLIPVLRVLARDRTPTAVMLATGAGVTGTIDRVGTDYLDLAEHSLDEPRRASVVRGVRTIAMSSVAVLRPRLEEPLWMVAAAAGRAAAGSRAMSEISPPARRLPSPRWFDLRFLAGIAIVVIPIVIGTHVLAAADRYATVYVAQRALVPGQHLVASDLVVGRVRFDGQGDRYISAGRPPVGYVVTRYVAAGELLPIAAVTATPTALIAERLVTVPVGVGHAPLDLARGDVVDVYVTEKSPAGDKPARPRLVIGAAPVDSVSAAGSLSSSGSVSVVIEVPAVAVGGVVKAIEGGTLDVVRVPGAAVGVVATPAPTSVPTEAAAQ